MAVSKDWSGRTWTVKHRMDQPAGPGPNYFSSENVQIDAKDILTLQMRHIDGKFTCGELYLEEPLGFGTYTFFVKSPLNDLAKEVTFGAFAYPRNESGLEIDIEAAHFDDNNPASSFNYVLHGLKNGTGDQLGIFSFPQPRFFWENRGFVHRFIWEPDRVSFESYTRAYLLDITGSIHFMNVAIASRTFPLPTAWHGVSADQSCVHINYYWRPKFAFPNVAPAKHISLSRFQFSRIEGPEKVSQSALEKNDLEIQFAIVIDWDRKATVTEPRPTDLVTISDVNSPGDAVDGIAWRAGTPLAMSTTVPGSPQYRTIWSIPFTLYFPDGDTARSAFRWWNRELRVEIRTAAYHVVGRVTLMAVFPREDDVRTTVTVLHK